MSLSVDCYPHLVTNSLRQSTTLTGRPSAKGPSSISRCCSIMLRSGWLVGAEGLHGFDGGGAQGGEPRGEKSGKGDGGADRCQHHGVALGGAVEHGPHDGSEQKRGGEAKGDADGEQARSLDEHHAHDEGAAGSESEADADFAATARDRVHHDTVKSDNREQERETGE